MPWILHEIRLSRLDWALYLFHDFFVWSLAREKVDGRKPQREGVARIRLAFTRVHRCTRANASSLSFTPWASAASAVSGSASLLGMACITGMTSAWAQAEGSGHGRVAASGSRYPTSLPDRGKGQQAAGTRQATLVRGINYRVRLGLGCKPHTRGGITATSSPHGPWPHLLCLLTAAEVLHWSVLEGGVVSGSHSFSQGGRVDVSSSEIRELDLHTGASKEGTPRGTHAKPRQAQAGLPMNLPSSAPLRRHPGPSVSWQLVGRYHHSWSVGIITAGLSVS